MLRSSNITHVILDFDGTVTNTDKEAIPFIKMFTEEFSKRIGLGLARSVNERDHIAEEIRNDPTKGWERQGIVVAPATADPYVFYSTVFGELMKQYTDPAKTGSHSLNIPPTQEQREQLLQDIFHVCYPHTDTVFRTGADHFLNFITDNYEAVIVTNSKPDAVEDKLSTLRIERKVELLIEVYGNAKKYEPTPDWDAVPEYTKPKGFPRPVWLRRKLYADVLEGLAEIGYTPKNTAVVGDIFELDLALPMQLGYRTILLETTGTQKHEIPFIKSQKNSYFAKDFNDVLEALEK